MSYLLTGRVNAESVLPSQFFADKATSFSAETYYVRILNVSPESVFLMTRRVLPSQFFCRVSFC